MMVGANKPTFSNENEWEIVQIVTVPERKKKPHNQHSNQIDERRKERLFNY